MYTFRDDACKTAVVGGVPNRRRHNNQTVAGLHASSVEQSEANVQGDQKT